MQEPSKPDSNKFQFTENRIGILIILGTIVIFQLLFSNHELVKYLLPQSNPMTFYYSFVLFPGFFSAILFAIITKKLIKALGIGILTVIFWFIWFIIYGLLTFTII